ncbi:hypothetical protein A0H81_11693 [Grifola frondosa]|uniref:Uncharacterized protein n=1 Tax=Grifola frondosa TaxID=5627 RepID=A0A1C7LTS7_GRIFR|nr:hypothetical protein A0H81_11693 [Grifola frondosa]
MQQSKKKRSAEDNVEDEDRVKKLTRTDDTAIADNTPRDTLAGPSGENHSSTSTLSIGDDNSNSLVAQKSYFDESFLGRVNNVRNVRDHLNNIYSVACLPAILEWGRTHLGKDLSALLCTSDNNPAVVWIIGEIKSKHLYITSGDRINAASIDIVAPTDVVYASAFLPSRSDPNADDFAIKTFTEIYDATKKLTAKSKMNKIVAGALHRNDVVVLEVHIKRYRVKDPKKDGDDDDKRGKARDFSWQSWKASFELLSIFQLFSPNDLDIYVNANNAAQLITYLRDDEHYEDRRNESPYHGSPFHALTPTLHYPLSGISCIMRLVRANRCIDVIISADDSPLTPLPYFWSTLVMNFVSADFICCAYPIPTLLYLCGIVNAARVLTTPIGIIKTMQCVQKYASRGYNLVFSPAEWRIAYADATPCESSPMCPARNQFFGDRASMTISLLPLPTSHPYPIDNYPSPVPPYNNRLTFILAGPSCMVGCPHNGVHPYCSAPISIMKIYAGKLFDPHTLLLAPNRVITANEDARTAGDTQSFSKTDEHGVDFSAEDIGDLRSETILPRFDDDIRLVGDALRSLVGALCPDSIPLALPSQEFAPKLLPICRHLADDGGERLAHGARATCARYEVTRMSGAGVGLSR